MEVREDALQGKVTRVPISFPDDLYEWLRRTAFDRRVSMAELVRESVRQQRDSLENQLDLWPQPR